MIRAVCLRYRCRLTLRISELSYNYVAHLAILLVDAAKNVIGLHAQMIWEKTEPRPETWRHLKKATPIWGYRFVPATISLRNKSTPGTMVGHHSTRTTFTCTTPLRNMPSFLAAA